MNSPCQLPNLMQSYTLHMTCEIHPFLWLEKNTSDHIITHEISCENDFCDNTLNNLENH